MLSGVVLVGRGFSLGLREDRLLRRPLAQNRVHYVPACTEPPGRRGFLQPDRLAPTLFDISLQQRNREEIGERTHD